MAKIFNDAVDYYEETLQTAYRIMGQPYRGVLAGGVFINVPEYAKAVCDRAPEGCTLQVIDTPTLYGAALEAMWLTDEEIPEGFKARFVETFARVRGKEADWQ